MVPATAASAARDHEGHRDGAVDIDADQRRHLLVLLAGALRAAEPGLGDQIPEAGEQHGGDAPDDELLVGQRHRDSRCWSNSTNSPCTIGGIDLLRGPCVTCTKFDRKIDMPIAEISGARRNEPRKRPVGDALDHPVDQRGEHHRHDQHDEQRERDRGDAEPGGQDQEGDQRDEGRHHEHVAMGEVHHADDAEHHRVADGDQAVDRAERDAVDELLEEDFHASLRRPFGLSRRAGDC